MIFGKVEVTNSSNVEASEPASNPLSKGGLCWSRTPGSEKPSFEFSKTGLAHLPTPLDCQAAIARKTSSHWTFDILVPSKYHIPLKCFILVECATATFNIAGSSTQSFSLLPGILSTCTMSFFLPKSTRRSSSTFLIHSVLRFPISLLLFLFILTLLFAISRILLDTHTTRWSGQNLCAARLSPRPDFSSLRRSMRRPGLRAALLSATSVFLAEPPPAADCNFTISRTV